MNLGRDLDSWGAVKALVMSFETRMASGTCRNRPRITGGTGGQVSGSGEVDDGNVFHHLRELSSHYSDGGITTKTPLFSHTSYYHETANCLQ